MNMSQLYVQSTGVSERQVDDVAFLANSQNDALYHLNPLAAALWRLLENPISGEGAVAVIHQAFPETDADSIAKDILHLIEELAAHSLIKKPPEGQ
ncbi:MAG: PqqD family protein [Rhodospirillaceae bacterium]|nr:PqqD family protein [Rhodospirillaceae bacterium]